MNCSQAVLTSHCQGVERRAGKRGPRPRWRDNCEGSWVWALGPPSRECGAAMPLLLLPTLGGCLGEVVGRPECGVG